jgi:uncharacterized damage-inducible protein DinB
MPASNLLTFRAMAYNNAWANHRLLSACAHLTQAEFEAQRIGFFPSIQATLNHILIIDWFYVDALEGGTLGPAAWANRIPCPKLEQLHAEQSTVDRRLMRGAKRWMRPVPTGSFRCTAAAGFRASAPIVCCCIFSSIRCIIAGRRTRC